MNPLRDTVADPDTHIVLVCGAGGVGKTSVSAALALRAAEAGRRVVVMTIDPARRLATALGIGELGNDPQPVPITGSGTLDAMMLDMKRTFDDAIRAHTRPEQAVELLANPFYQALSSSFAGTQEYMAMEKLGELARRVPRRWDLIVVDTPPSAAALDFLDAPERLHRLLEGRILGALLAPVRGPLRFLGAGMSLVTRVLSAVLGGPALRDLQTFLTAFEGLTGGFRERADRTRATLAAPGTACVVVTTPDADALREAQLLTDRLATDALRLRGVVLNRLQPNWPALADPAQPDAPGSATAWARQAVAEARKRRAAQEARADVLTGLPVVRVPWLTDEVVDLDGLRRLAAHLMGDAAG